MQELPLEKQLTIADFNQRVQTLSREDAITLLQELHKHHVITHCLYQEMLKKYMLPELQ